MFSPAKFLTFLVVALLGFVNIAAAATPPACLIDIVGSEPNPNDVATICKKDSIASDIASNCGSEKADAMTAYASVCKAAGVTVSTSIASSASATKSGSSTAAATGSSASATGSSSSSSSSASAGSSSASDSASSTSTPAPSSDAPDMLQKNLGLVLAGAVSFAVGAVALL